MNLFWESFAASFHWIVIFAGIISALTITWGFCMLFIELTDYIQDKIVKWATNRVKKKIQGE